MSQYSELTTESLNELHQQLSTKFEGFKAQGLKLDMTRGKPCPEQLDLANGMLNCLEEQYRAADGTDCRNYGGIEGIAEARRLFAEYLEVLPEQTLVQGNSSLQLMYLTVAQAFTHGVPDSPRPWCREEKVKAICPSPGYDRHFRVSEHFGIESITVPLLADGPDMDMIERLVQEDESIRLIWLVPRYSNPTGITFSDEVVERFARLKPKAKDLRLIWDDAYAVHHLGEGADPLRNILDACTKAGCPERVFMYGSTSKISFAGGGVSFMAASERNIEWMKSHIFVQTVGPDKLNMLRHMRFFGNMDGIRAHMDKHAAILKPKFDVVNEQLDAALSGKGIAQWTKPRGGYFISLDTLEGCAREVVARCKSAGVLLTAAGATYPSGGDPQDRNIRLAPSFPSVEDLRLAAEVLTTAVQLVSIEKLLEQR